MAAAKTRQGRLKEREGVSLTGTLMTGVCVRLALSVLSVLSIGIWSAPKNTLNLLKDQACLAIALAITQIGQNLKLAIDQTEPPDNLIARDALDPDDKERFSSLLIAALAIAVRRQNLSDN